MVFPALAGFRKDAWTPQRGVLRSTPILARPALLASRQARRLKGRGTMPARIGEAFLKPARAGKINAFFRIVKNAVVGGMGMV